MTSLWPALIGAIPAILAAVLNLLGQGAHGRQLQRIEKQLPLLEQLPDDAKARLEQLIAREVEDFSASLDRRDSRKLDGNSVIALVFVTAVGALVGWGVVELAIAAWPVWYLFVPAILLAALVGGLTLGLMVTGVLQVWKYDDGNKTKGKSVKMEK